MRILIDACVGPRIAGLFSLHDVRTASEMGWQSVTDSRLVEAMQDRFDVLITIDRGFEFQQNLRKLVFGLVIVHVARNKVEFYREIAEALREAVTEAGPGRVIHVWHSSWP